MKTADEIAREVHGFDCNVCTIAKDLSRAARLAQIDALEWVQQQQQELAHSPRDYGPKGMWNNLIGQVVAKLRELKGATSATP